MGIRRLCLVDFELCGNTRAGISRQAFAIFQPAFFGEIALTLWLIVKGAKPPASDAAAPFVGG